MKTIYAISGLGMDKEAFAKLDLCGYKMVYVEWLKPDVNESFEAYTLRLANHYSIPQKGAYVIGLSLGGMCLVELAKQYNFEKVVLISTIKTKYELPAIYRLSKYFPLYKLLPDKKLTFSKLFLNWFFTSDNKEEKVVLRKVINEIDPTFLKWGMHNIINWNNEKLPTDFLHIHGQKDRIFPIRKIKYVMRIREGGHILTVNSATALSYHIKRYLDR